MKEYEVTFTITGTSKVTIWAEDDEDLWDKIDSIKDDIDIEQISEVDVTGITEY